MSFTCKAWSNKKKIDLKSTYIIEKITLDIFGLFFPEGGRIILIFKKRKSRKAAFQSPVCSLQSVTLWLIGMEEGTHTL